MLFLGSLGDFLYRLEIFDLDEMPPQRHVATSVVIKFYSMIEQFRSEKLEQMDKALHACWYFSRRIEYENLSTPDAEDSVSFLNYFLGKKHGLTMAQDQSY
ncbi:Hypothetical protein NTJ_11663 [Nesidiocoris tenuis]|uniref:Uncharacterized protein n=1 Tax=Nesidiocoris tenuis TaxID=355587 RepID=A0ABN7B377_9HEMI|nr:Hypothetical protein NTJ_11663 [Nesidiocoris tenuis]